MTREYAFASHVAFTETEAPHPTREELIAERELADRRRDRAARARAHIRGDDHA